jgi:GNAT superfamily N-acetyltransferase
MPTPPPTVDELYRAMGRMTVRFYGRTPGADSVIASHAILGCSGLDNVFLNCGVVFGDGADGDDPAEGRLREFVARIDARGIGGYVCLSESVQAELEPLARELGLEPLPAVPLMARAAPAPAAAGAELTASAERVVGEAGLTEFLSVSEAAFDLPADLYRRVVTPELLRDPALSVYLLRQGGAAVSCVCVVEDDGLVGISGMATLPEVQGRGLGGRLLEAVIGRHRAKSRAFFLIASESGRQLYLRHGFEVVDAATAWVVPPRRA